MPPALAALAALALAFAPSGAARADDDRPLVTVTLQQALESARTRSPGAVAARHRFRGSYWEYVTYRAETRPSLDLASGPVSLERNIFRQTLPDGTDEFVHRAQLNSYASLSLGKVIGGLGGRLALRTDFARTEALQGGRTVSFSATPVAVTFDQPLFAYNPYRWARQIEPRRYDEARQQLVEDIEGLSLDALVAYFELLTSQAILRDARDEKLRSDTLLAVAEARRSRAADSDNDVLQAQLAQLNADLGLSRARLDEESRQQRLATLLGASDAPTYVPGFVTDVPRPHVDLGIALEQARRNKPVAMAFDRRLLEADRTVAQARASRGSTSLHASYGLSQSASSLDALYRNPSTDQVTSLSVSMPLLDWGRTAASIAIAESQREVTRRQVEQSRADFDRDVFLRVSEFDIQSRQLDLSARADSIAQRRYDMTRGRWLAGRGDLDALGQAQRERDSARRGWLDALRSYWTAYYSLRLTTLYDFERGEPLRVTEPGR